MMKSKNKSKRRLLTGRAAAIFACIAVLSAVGLNARSEPDEPAPAGRETLEKAAKRSPVKNFKLRDQYDREIQLSAFRGQYVHLDFSAVWCGPCRGQARYMAKLEKELEGYGFVSISIIVTRNPAAAKRWARRYGLKHVVVDSSRRVKKSFGVRGYPTNIILRPDLRVAHSHAGAHRSPRLFRRWLRRSIPEMFREQPVENNNARVSGGNKIRVAER